MVNGIWQDLAGVVAVMAGLCTLYLWVTRRVIREELQRFSEKEIERVQEDVEVLRVAVFNHVSHDEQLPSEDSIREVLGYGQRRQGRARGVHVRSR